MIAHVLALGNGEVSLKDKQGGGKNPRGGGVGAPVAKDTMLPSVIRYTDLLLSLGSVA